MFPVYCKPSFVWFKLEELYPLNVIEEDRKTAETECYTPERALATARLSLSPDNQLGLPESGDKALLATDNKQLLLTDETHIIKKKTISFLAE